MSQRLLGLHPISLARSLNVEPGMGKGNIFDTVLNDLTHDPGKFREELGIFFAVLQRNSLK